MKRKLDANDVPVPASETHGPKEEITFSGLGLDARILQATSKQNFQAPTPVQAKAIPFALDGRDVLAKAKTGSGKTAAYILPVLHSILKRKSVCFANLVQDPTNVYRPLQLSVSLLSYLCRHANLLSKSTK
jgi:ATP-dependent RNA helicase DDX56/DBP9